MTSPSVHAIEPSQLLHYLPTYRVLICLRCNYAIQPGAVARHLKEIHHLHHLSRRPFVDYASGFKLSQTSDVVLPDETQFPVPLLPVQNGLACSFAGCAHLCVTAKRMKQHWMSWRFLGPSTAADIFRGNALHYFTNPALLISSSSDKSGGPTNTNRKSSPYQMLITSDAGLLDHYRNYTYKTLSCGPETDDAFQIIVPQLAHQFPFLLHGILSCSSLHLASIDPKNRPYYTIRSIQHADQAAPAFRWATINVDSNNSQAVLAFAFFLVVYTLGSESNDQPLFLSKDISRGEDAPSLEWIEILRNGCSMLCPFWTELTTSPLAPFTALWRDDLGVPTNPNDPLLITLLSVIPEYKSESTDHYIYRDSAVKLARAFAFIERFGSPPTIWDVLNSWPMRVSPEYLALLKHNNPGALLLLAHYAILLKPLREEWFLKGRVMELIDKIAQRLKGNCSPQIWEVFSVMQREHFASDAI
ncbi:transcriptional regulator family: Fungal Specific TF [Penicillium mononematosum]|uniref:transcriptional regulator family: Fungal Specific TF n=1 Tax=Penicillium mononematosum TaxID=268346 RepID=UPI002548D426|nr:transcriptional regulator family: Fungal Specific TF [Penicillium mononematosum]KAJ6189214.1 transcriptional regulator family: Fungal Specific TF [Penicillium mononematosum]